MTCRRRTIASGTLLLRLALLCMLVVLLGLSVDAEGKPKKRKLLKTVKTTFVEPDERQTVSQTTTKSHTKSHTKSETHSSSQSKAAAQATKSDKATTRTTPKKSKTKKNTAKTNSGTGGGNLDDTLKKQAQDILSEANFSPEELAKIEKQLKDALENSIDAIENDIKGILDNNINENNGEGYDDDEPLIFDLGFHVEIDGQPVETTQVIFFSADDNTTLAEHGLSRALETFAETFNQQQLEKREMIKRAKDRNGNEAPSKREKGFFSDLVVMNRLRERVSIFYNFKGVESYWMDAPPGKTSTLPGAFVPTHWVFRTKAEGQFIFEFVQLHGHESVVLEYVTMRDPEGGEPFETIIGKWERTMQEGIAGYSDAIMTQTLGVDKHRPELTDIRDVIASLDEFGTEPEVNIAPVNKEKTATKKGIEREGGVRATGDDDGKNREDEDSDEFDEVLEFFFSDADEAQA